MIESVLLFFVLLGIAALAVSIFIKTINLALRIGAIAVFVVLCVFVAKILL